MATTHRCLLLLQLGAAVAAASCLLAASCPVDAALPPPPSRDVSATTDDTDVTRTIDGDVAAVAVSRGSRRLGPARRLSDIPSGAPAAAAYDDIFPADAPAPAASSPACDAAAASHPWTILDVALGIVLSFLAALGGGLVLAFLVLGLIMGAVGLVKGAALLASAIADLYTATRVHPLDEDAGN